MRRIQSKKHKIDICEVDKISLSCFDDKRFVLDYGIHTLAYFHQDLRKKILTKEEKILTNDHKQKEILPDENR